MKTKYTWNYTYKQGQTPLASSSDPSGLLADERIFQESEMKMKTHVERKWMFPPSLSRPYLFVSKSASPDSRNVCVCCEMLLCCTRGCGSAPFVQLSLGVYSQLGFLV